MPTWSWEILHAEVEFSQDPESGAQGVYRCLGFQGVGLHVSNITSSLRSRQRSTDKENHSTKIILYRKQYLKLDALAADVLQAETQLKPLSDKSSTTPSFTLHLFTESNEPIEVHSLDTLDDFSEIYPADGPGQDTKIIDSPGCKIA